MEVFRHLGSKIEDYVADKDLDEAFQAADLILKQLNRRTDAVLFGYNGSCQRWVFRHKDDSIFVCDDEMAVVADQVKDVARGTTRGHGLQAPFTSRCSYSPTTWCALKRALERLRDKVRAICYGGPCDGDMHNVDGVGEQRISPSDEAIQKTLCGLLPVYNVVDRRIDEIAHYSITDGHRQHHKTNVHAALFIGFSVPTELVVSEGLSDVSISPYP